jgi:hypothetical protein
LPQLDDEELRTTLIAQCIIPALKKMLASFKDSENPYRYLLEAVCSTLGSEVGLASDANKTIAMNRRMSLPVLQPANRMS